MGSPDSSSSCPRRDTAVQRSRRSGGHTAWSVTTRMAWKPLLSMWQGPGSHLKAHPSSSHCPCWHQCPQASPSEATLTAACHCAVCSPQPQQGGRDRCSLRTQDRGGAALGAGGGAVHQPSWNKQQLTVTSAQGTPRAALRARPLEASLPPKLMVAAPPTEQHQPLLVSSSDTAPDQHQDWEVWELFRTRDHRAGATRLQALHTQHRNLSWDRLQIRHKDVSQTEVASPAT